MGYPNIRRVDTDINTVILGRCSKEPARHTPTLTSGDRSARKGTRRHPPPRLKGRSGRPRSLSRSTGHKKFQKTQIGNLIATAQKPSGRHDPRTLSGDSGVAWLTPSYGVADSPNGHQWTPQSRLEAYGKLGALPTLPRHRSAEFMVPVG